MRASRRSRDKALESGLPRQSADWFAMAKEGTRRVSPRRCAPPPFRQGGAFTRIPTSVRHSRSPLSALRATSPAGGSKQPAGEQSSPLQCFASQASENKMQAKPNQRASRRSRDKALESGLPRQSADWFAMAKEGTGEYPPGAVRHPPLGKGGFHANPNQRASRRSRDKTSEAQPAGEQSSPLQCFASHAGENRMHTP